MSSQPIRKVYSNEYISSVIRDNRAKSESLQTLTENVMDKKVQLKDLQKRLEAAQLKLKQKRFEKAAEIRKVNSRIVAELDNEKVKNQLLQIRINELEEDLKKAMKRGLKRPSPWWYLHTDPVPEYVELILEAQCKFCHATFKTSKGTLESRAKKSCIQCHKQ